MTDMFLTFHRCASLLSSSEFCRLACMFFKLICSRYAIRAAHEKCQKIVLLEPLCIVCCGEFAEKDPLMMMLLVLNLILQSYVSVK